MKLKILPCFFLFSLSAVAQNHIHLEIPPVLTEFSFNNCQLTLAKNGQLLKELGKKDPYSYSAFSVLAKKIETWLLLMSKPLEQFVRESN